MPSRITLDRSCFDVPAANDKAVQAQALEALRRSLSAQSRNPNGPQTIEYGFAGRPAFWGPGFVPHEIVAGKYDGVDIPHWRYDTFDVHTHPNINQDPRPTGMDWGGMKPGDMSIIIDHDGVARCYKKD